MTLDGDIERLLHVLEERFKTVKRSELEPATKIAPDKPQVEEKQDEKGCDFVESADFLGFNNALDEPYAERVGNDIANA